MTDKRTLRLTHRHAREAKPTAARAAAAEKIKMLFLAHATLAAAQVVAAYHPIRAELSPLPLVDALWQQGTSVALPALEQNKIVFRAWRAADTLIEGAFGIWQPARDCALLVPEVILLPCLAFDRAGTRLGYGAGHYDRALATSAALNIGLAYASQETAHIFNEPHDIALDGVLTEEAVLLLTNENK